MIRLREARREAGLSQAQLAEITGVSPTTIAHIETGANDNPRPATLKKLANGLGIEIKELTRVPVQLPAGVLGFMSVEDLKKLQGQ